MDQNSETLMTLAAVFLFFLLFFPLTIMAYLLFSNNEKFEDENKESKSE